MSRNTAYRLFERAIPESVCDIIVAEGKALKSQAAELHKTEGNTVNEDKRKTNVAFWAANHWINGLLHHHIHLANQEIWNYHITFTQGVQFGIYGPGGNYQWHKDEFDKPYGENSAPAWQGLARKLSAVVNLTDPAEYTQGQLLFRDTHGVEVKDEDFKQRLAKKGSVVVFPATILHAVTPVASGERCSLVSWMLGKPFV